MNKIIIVVCRDTFANIGNTGNILKAAGEAPNKAWPVDVRYPEYKTSISDQLKLAKQYIDSIKTAPIIIVTYSDFIYNHLSVLLREYVIDNYDVNNQEEALSNIACFLEFKNDQFSPMKFTIQDGLEDTVGQQSIAEHTELLFNVSSKRRTKLRKTYE